MPIIIPSKKTGTTRGSGPEKSVCFLLIKNGLGDAIHCMPTIWQMTQDGYSVTVYCRAFHVPIFESIPGVSVRVPFENELSAGWMDSAKTIYGRILDFPHWGGWECSAAGENVRPQIEQFAKLCDVTLPSEFSWIDLLRPERTFEESYILFAPESTEVWRTLPEEIAAEAFDAMREFDNVKYITTKRELTTEAAFEQLIGAAEELHPDCDWRKVMAEGNALKEEFDKREADRLIGKTTFSDVRDLINCIFNASHIVTAESGISNVAGALGKSMTVLCSVTDPKQLIGQYIEPAYTVVRGIAPEMTCVQPCWRHPKNGFTDDKCCGVSDGPMCLAAISAEQILETLPLLQGD